VLEYCATGALKVYIETLNLEEDHYFEVRNDKLRNALLNAKLFF
jgi:hypothetical protein